MPVADHLPKEVLKAEVLDWWEEQQELLSNRLEARLPELLALLDAEIDAMPVKSFFRKGKFHAERLEPVVVEFLEKNYAEFTSELDEAFQKSVAHVEAEELTTTLNSWSYKEMATAGAAVAVSAAPLAALPFLTGGIFTSGVAVLGFTVVAPTLIPLAVGAAATGLVVAAAGPTARMKALERLKSSFKEVTGAEARVRVVGDPQKPEIGSLKGTLMKDLRNVALGRIEALS